MKKTESSSRQPHEKSFTLLETIIALGLMVTIVLEIAGVQGNAISFSDYGRKMSQALWLARAVLSEVEYKSKFYPIKEIAAEEKDREFDERLCPKDPECDFRYSLTIEKWDLPIVDLAVNGMSGGGGSDDEDKESGGNPFASMIKDQLKSILGEDIFKVAHVEVTWAEGARTNSVDLAYLFANQKGVDEYIETLHPVGASSQIAGAKKECPPSEKMKDGVCVKDNIPPAGGGAQKNPNVPLPHEPPSEEDVLPIPEGVDDP